MNKFSKTITQGKDGILSERAKNLSDQAKLEQEALVQEKKRAVLKTEQELNALTDIAPDSTVSLHPGGNGKGFDAKVWVTKLHELQLQLVEAKLEQEIAEKTLLAWFGEIEAPTAQA